LLGGKLWLKINPKGRGLQVKSPASVASIMGTELLLDSTEEGDKIIVLTGEVKFTGSLGDQITVKGGQWGIARPGQPLDPPQPTPPIEEIRKAEELCQPLAE